MPDKDLYNVLGLDRGADEKALKQAYKRLAMKYHPDRNKTDDAEQKFKEIQQAYSVLSDPEKRASYNRFGTTDFSGAGGGGHSPFGDFGDFSDVFNSFFNEQSSNGGHRRTRQQGRDLQIKIELDLEDAVAGCSRKVELNAYRSCATCDGSGARSSSGRQTCPQCRGVGQVQRRVAILVMQEPCPQCSGSGQIIKDPCTDCNGQGRARERRPEKIDIPAGVDQDDRLRLSGKGEAGIANGPSGDLYVDIRVRPHLIFQRSGENLSCQMPISFATATLGGEAEVPTLSGYKTVVIPKGFQSGKRIKVRGAGVKNVRSAQKGDLYCTVIVETPQNLSTKQTETLRKFDESLQKNPKKHSPESVNWLNRAKKLFSKNS